VAAVWIFARGKAAQASYPFVRRGFGPPGQSQSNTHPTQSMAATSAAISRTTTTTFCEVVKLPEITFQRRTHSNQFAASENYRIQ
jgi:hypothetical protein